MWCEMDTMTVSREENSDEFMKISLEEKKIFPFTFNFDMISNFQESYKDNTL